MLGKRSLSVLATFSIGSSRVWIIATAKMLKRHLDRVVIYLKQRITNARPEAFNSGIQWLKSAARGFRSFRTYQTCIVFFCVRLDMVPAGCH